MTRNEWIQRYVSAMKAGGSLQPDDHLIEIASAGCDASEQAGDTNPAHWEAPERIADEHLEGEGQS